MFICEFDVFANILKEAFVMLPFASIILMAVSSQDVSMLKILMCLFMTPLELTLSKIHENIQRASRVLRTPFEQKFSKIRDFFKRNF
jgi:hypothetical protein